MLFPAEKADGKSGAKRREAGHHAHRQQDASRVDAEKGVLHHGNALCQREEADDLPSRQFLLFCFFDLKRAQGDTVRYIPALLRLFRLL